MANINLVTTAIQDSAIQYMTDENNKRFAPRTPVQFLKDRIDELINSWIVSYNGDRTLSKGKLYQKATPEDQATIDAILQKYNV